MSNYLHKVVIGTAQFGLDYGISNKFGKVSYDEISQILEIAWENGIRTLDTAKIYGNSEKIIGKYLKERPNQEWRIITKVNTKGKSFNDQLNDSIEKLFTIPYLVLAHSSKIYLSGIMNKKLVNKLGVSIYEEEEIKEVMKSAIKPEAIQLPLNILDTRLFKSGILNNLNNNNIEVHVRSVFLQGLFYLSDSELSIRFSHVKPYLKKLRSIASKANLTLAELSLLWLVNLKEVDKIVIGVENSDQLLKHIETINKKIDQNIFEEALLINYKNKSILNPSLWK